MIISTACERELSDFKKLIERMDATLNRDAKSREDYYVSRGGKKLEEDVFRALSYCAKGTLFDGSINLVSGASFPDIIAKNIFGVEVKSTEKNQWQSIGSSILESTRNKSVERIFMTFGKLGRPVEFLSKPYEECLSDIVVTHYPRYRIDMHLQENNEQTIFEKMHIEYDVLRNMDEPVPPVANYYRSLLNEGESLWWAPEDVEASTPMKARLWTALSPEEKESVIVEAYCFFPEVMGRSSTKYNRCALWLATNKGIINTNIRDSFSAGGKVDMMTKEGVVTRMPAAFGRIKKYRRQIVRSINQASERTLKDSWKREIQDNRLKQWGQLVADYASEVVGQALAESVLECIFYGPNPRLNKLLYTISPDLAEAAETEAEYL